MNYEKKYKDALEMAKDYFKANQKIGESEENDMLSDIFPELAESEDEKIRKTLIAYMKSVIDINGIKGETITAWLEKQKPKKFNGVEDLDKAISTAQASFKQKLNNWSEEDEKQLQELVIHFNLEGGSLQHSEKRIIKWLESLKRRMEEQ